MGQFSKLKSSCTTKETVNKTKGQQTKWDKIFANNTPDRGLISKIHILKIQLKKWTEDMNRHFSQEDIKMANRYMKRCSNSLAVREMQIKTTIRYHLVSVRRVIINKTRNYKCWRGCIEKGSFTHCCAEC